jgi:hypothetical protein
LSTALVASLRAAGHDVSYVAEVASGMTDEEVLKLAQDEQRVFLTEDKDFGELIFAFVFPRPALCFCASMRRERLSSGPGCKPWSLSLETGCSDAMSSLRKPGRACVL